MVRRRTAPERDGVSGIGLPLFGSAAGHVILLWALLLPGAATDLHGEGAIIQVLLVKEPTSVASVAGGYISARAIGPTRGGAAIRTGERNPEPPRPASVASLPGPLPPQAFPVIPPVVGPSARAEEDRALERPSSGPVSVSRDGGSPRHHPHPVSAPFPRPLPSPVSPAISEAARRSVDTDPPGEAGAPEGNGETGPAVLPGAGPGPVRAGPTGGEDPPDARFPGSGVRVRPARGGAGGGGGDFGRLAVLRARIQERIVYPEEAVRRGQEGEVLLRIRIGNGGVPREIRVARSSGARILDEAARRGVARAAPLPSDPGWFEIPIRFSLR